MDADAARERPLKHNAVPQPCMPRHFNNLENLTETTAPDNPAFDYIRMKPRTNDNRVTCAAFDYPA
ncbi:hypothetical protein [Burkholderia seminalis]|uniref:hypothetical protein n=1 Tax=Burkholderia seminalis TaxID=488731 RepID=UPI0019077793|nr:hypothetical protein [Burkholderia seminalis]MBJ9591162.1 hypothetical protein [Burkholderia seminalis]